MNIFKLGDTEFSWQLEENLPEKLHEFHLITSFFINFTT